jgi:CRP-like cAMP-binding protein
VVTQAAQHEDRLLRQRQHAALLRRHRDAVQHGCRVRWTTSHEHPRSYIDERHNIETGAWFSKLSSRCAGHPSRAVVRRLADGAPLASRGTPGREVVRRGARRGARQLGVAVGQAGHADLREPGTWFGDIALFDGLPRTHDAHAHGDTTLLVVRKPDFKDLLAQHVELYDALLRLNCRRLRLMFDQFEDLNTRPLQARLAKQLLLLARATASSRATRSASACSWRRKTWRSCWVRRASASTRSSRASSARARCASNPRGWWCCRATSCSPPPNAEAADTMEHFTGTKPVPAARLRRRCARPPGSPALRRLSRPADGRAVQGRAVQPDLQAAHARRAPT